MSEHTPGPWKINPSNRINQLRIDRITENGTVDPVGLVYGAGKNISDTAHLVSAAPEMLEALEKVKSIMSDDGLDFEERSRCSFEVIDMALAKAKGVLDLATARW